MRFTLRLVMCLLILSVPLGAQQMGSWKLSSLTVGSGEDPITSGTSITAGLERGSHLFEVAFQHEQAWVAYGPKFGVSAINGSLLATVGHFQSAPWVGPRLLLNIPLADDVSFGLIEWPCIFLEKPTAYKSHKLSQPMIGQYGGVSLTLSTLTFSLGQQKFLDERVNLLPGVTYNLKLSNEYSATVGGTYNNNGSRWMYYISGSWSPASSH